MGATIDWKPPKEKAMRNLRTSIFFIGNNEEVIHQIDEVSAKYDISFSTADPDEYRKEQELAKEIKRYVVNDKEFVVIIGDTGLEQKEDERYISSLITLLRMTLRRTPIIITVENAVTHNGFKGFYDAGATLVYSKWQEKNSKHLVNAITRNLGPLRKWKHFVV